MKIETQILEELRSSGASFTSLSPHWELRAHSPELYEALAAIEPGLGSIYELLRRELPAQRQWAFNTHGALSRPDRHVRAFYILLDKLKSISGGRGALAVKGTEPISENFAQVPKRMDQMWNVFSWTIGGANREVLEDWALLTQVERFPLIEGKPPAVHPVADAEEEAQCALELQSAYLKRFGKLAKIPTPLFVYRLPDAIRERAVAAIRPYLSHSMMALAEAQIGAALGGYIYHYPTLPLRAFHLRGDVGPDLSFDTRHKTLAALSDPAQAIAGWMRLVAEFLALGWVPTDPANFSRGYCVMGQNLVIDGGIVDVNSIRPSASFRNAGELEFAVRHTVRELTQSISWYLVGADAGMVRFQHTFTDVYARVWEGLRKELATLKPPAEIAAIFLNSDSIYQAISRTFRNYYELGLYRPQDAERDEYQSSK